MSNVTLKNLRKQLFYSTGECPASSRAVVDKLLYKVENESAKTKQFYLWPMIDKWWSHWPVILKH